MSISKGSANNIEKNYSSGTNQMNTYNNSSQGSFFQTKNMINHAKSYQTPSKFGEYLMGSNTQGEINHAISKNVIMNNTQNNKKSVTRGDILQRGANLEKDYVSNQSQPAKNSLTRENKNSVTRENENSVKSTYVVDSDNKFRYQSNASINSKDPMQKTFDVVPKY